MEGRFSHTGSGYELVIDEDGDASLLFPAGVRLLDLNWRLVLTDGSILEPSSCEGHAEGTGRFATRVVLGDGQAAVHATWTCSEDGACVTAELENLRPRPARLQTLALRTGPCGLRLSGDWRQWFLYRMAWNVSEPSGMVRLGSLERAFAWRFPPPGLLPGSLRRMLFNEGTRFSNVTGEFRSEWLTLLSAPDGQASVAAGFCGFDAHFGQVAVDGSRSTLSVEAQLDGCRLDMGGRRPLDPIAFLPAADPFAGLRRWAREAAGRSHVRVRTSRLWCSWYSGFYDHVTEEGLEANVRLLQPLHDRLDTLQLDDGYQKVLGDWFDTNDRFPGGLERVASLVREAGFRPGIWTAPFALSPRSRTALDHPDWLVRDDAGQPVVAGFVMGRHGPRWYFALDTTNPEAQGWLGATFARLYATGFRLFKLDFLTAAAVAGTRRDPSRTRCEAYRDGLRAIREALPSDAVLLAGISPVLAGVGLVDIQRLGPDTAYGSPTWRGWLQSLIDDRSTPGLQNAVSASLQRAFLDGILFAADCDAVIRTGLAEPTFRLLATVNLLAGSTFCVGHDFRKGPFDFRLSDELSEHERGEPAVLDLAGNRFPRHFLLRTTRDGKDYRWYAVLNPEPRPERLLPLMDRVAPGTDRVAARDFWEDRDLDLVAGQEVEVPPRGVRLFVIRR
jgi:hypothetical protein